MSGPVDKVLAALRAAGCEPRKSGAGWSTRCPAHDDRKPSLSIGVGNDGRALLTCHAGCPLAAVLAALGLTERDLFEEHEISSNQALAPARRSRSIWSTPESAIADLARAKGPPTSTWTYRDAEDDPVGVVLRWDRAGDDKDILPMSHAEEGWALRAMRPPRPLYNLAAIAGAKRVVICEGEKAADAAISLGFAATTSAGGCKAPAQTDWSPLAGKHIVILPDHDEAGERYADAVRALAIKVGAASVRRPGRDRRGPLQ